jgi:hypothetical protein
MSKLLNYIHENYFTQKQSTNGEENEIEKEKPCKIVMSPILSPMDYEETVKNMSLSNDMHDIDLNGETSIIYKSVDNCSTKTSIVNITTNIIKSCAPFSQDATTQTEIQMEFDERKNDIIRQLENEINVLKIKNAKLETNFRDISGLLASFTKIDTDNPELDTIRQKLIILLNRELRMNYAFPFSNILSKSF